MTKKRALFVATVDIHIRKFHLPYLKLLKERGYEVHVATNGDEKFDECDKKHKICIERSPYSIKNIRAIQQLKKIIKEEKFELIHCHTPMGSVVARLAAKKFRKKLNTRVIYTVHGFHFYKGAPIINWIIFYPIEKWLAKYTDTLITINMEDYELAKNKLKNRCKDIKYIPGVGVDTEKLNFEMDKDEKSKYRESLGLNDNDFIMVFPARLDKNKNQKFLIDVMEKLVENYSNIHLLLPGSDELNGYYQNIVKERNLEKNIHFLGFRQDVEKLLKISNIALSSSLREGLPVNIIESLAVGVPIVALKCRGMEELVEDGKNGYLIEINSNTASSDFQEAILKIYNANTEQIKEIETNNINKSMRYKLDAIIKEYDSVY